MRYLICTRDLTIADRVAAAVDGRTEHVRELRAVVEAAAVTRPDAVLLDVRAGGNAARAVEVIPDVMEAAPDAVVVIVTFSPTASEVHEANVLGAYTWLDMKRGNWATRLSEISAVLKQRWRIAVPVSRAHRQRLLRSAH